MPRLRREMIEGGLYHVYNRFARGEQVFSDPEYTLSGHRELMGKIRSPLCDVDEALLGFGDTVKTARRAYVSDLKQSMKEDGQKVSPGTVTASAPLQPRR
ncbi:MAG: hypothetical protein K8R59_03365 [Thermoanaerobaculales bacterium]|nr:hypothetical protein [Thermoanaerobaculales bacterium]